jgi:heptosyltransferase-2
MGLLNRMRRTMNPREISSTPIEQPSTIDQRPSTLVIQTAFLGDVVLTTPLLDALAARHGPVDVVTTPGAVQLLETHPAVRRVIRHDKRGTASGVAGIRALAAELRAARYARAYLAHRSWRSGLAAMLAGIAERIGFADAPARWTYTQRVPRPPAAHETTRLLALAGAHGPARPTLGLTSADRAQAAAWLETGNLRGRFVAVAPGSIWGTKRWDKYPELVAALDLPVVVLGGPEDRELGHAVLAGAAVAGLNAAGALPIRVSAAVLERATALVSNDSLPLHLAQAVGTPVVAIFGPTVPAFGFGPQGDRDAIVEHDDLPCRPCSLHGPLRCPLRHHRCMRDLDVWRVQQALAPLLHA